MELESIPDDTNQSPTTLIPLNSRDVYTHSGSCGKTISKLSTHQPQGEQENSTQRPGIEPGNHRVLTPNVHMASAAWVPPGTDVQFYTVWGSRRQMDRTTNEKDDKLKHIRKPRHSSNQQSQTLPPSISDRRYHSCSISERWNIDGGINPFNWGGPFYRLGAGDIDVPWHTSPISMSAIDPRSAPEESNQAKLWRSVTLCVPWNPPLPVLR